MVSLTFWLAGLSVDGPPSLKLIGCGGVPVNAVNSIIRQVVKCSGKHKAAARTGELRRLSIEAGSCTRIVPDLGESSTHLRVIRVFPWDPRTRQGHRT